MSFRQDISAEPERFDLLGALRNFERSAPEKPRIGDNAVLREEVVRLGQDPFLAFPQSNISEFGAAPSGVPLILSRFLGYFGPHGALPLSTTMEAYEWSLRRDVSFARFTDIFSNRFLQLFYRAWADARPIAQFDRPEDDRFFVYLGSLAGIGVASHRDRDSLPDIAKLGFAGIAGAQAKSAERLRQIVHGLCGVAADIEERSGTWLTFEPQDLSRLGRKGAALGQDAMLGAKVFSINDKFRVKIKTVDFEQYQRFLPGAEMAQKLADAVFFFVGLRFEFDVQLFLPARCAPPARLGRSGSLGLTAWLAPKTDVGDEVMLDDARYHPMQRKMGAGGRQGRTAPPAAAAQGGER